MLFNVEKCVVMDIGISKLHIYNMNIISFKTVELMRDLGAIKILRKVFNGCKKNICLLDMINRNIKCKNSDIITRFYKSMMRPTLEYCVQIWSPYLKKDNEVSERVQKRATNMVYGCWVLTYTDRLASLNLPIFEARRVMEDLIETSKLLKGMDKIDFRTFPHIIGGL